MKTSKSRNTTWLVMMVALMAAGGTVRATDATRMGAPQRDQDNRLEVQRFRAENMSVTLPGGGGGGTTRQELFGWSVNRGRWNGEMLDGLSLVMVKSPADESQTNSDVRIYVSSQATPAQRAALLSVISSTHPGLFPSPDKETPQIEPAFIRLERVDGQSIILHLALVA